VQCVINVSHTQSLSMPSRLHAGGLSTCQQAKDRVGMSRSIHEMTCFTRLSDGASQSLVTLPHSLVTFTRWPHFLTLWSLVPLAHRFWRSCLAASPSHLPTDATAPSCLQPSPLQSTTTPRGSCRPRWAASKCPPCRSDHAGVPHMQIRSGQRRMQLFRGIHLAPHGSDLI
jgi:hypothetical protein